jgi:hypothetical protein
MEVYHLPPLHAATVAAVLMTVSGHLIRPLVATTTVLPGSPAATLAIMGMLFLSVITYRG